LIIRGKYIRFLGLFLLVLCAASAKTQEVVYPSEAEIQFARRFIDAEKERHLGNYQASLELFDRCLILNPQSDAVHFGKGKVYLEQEQYGLAETAFESAYTLNPDNKWYALSYAQVLLDQLKFKEASQVYKKVSASYPQDTELKLDYANTLLFAGKEKAALKVYDEIEAITGPSHEINLRKSEYFISQHKYEAAVVELKKLIALYPEDTQLYGMLAELYRVQGKVDEAIQMFQDAYKANPTNPIFQLSLAEYYDRTNELDTAFSYLKKAFLNPNLDIDRKVGVLLRMYDKAEQDQVTRQRVLGLCEAVVETHPGEAKAYSIYGDFLNLEGDKTGALRQFHKATELDPSRFAIWSQILLIESELNLTEALADDSERALELFPAQPTVYFFNGIANTQLERWEAAVKSLRIGAQMVIGNNALSAQMLASLGDAYHEVGREMSSDSAYEAALLFDPNNTYVLNNYSYFLSLRGVKLERAKEMSAKTLTLEPDNPSYLDTYGWILYKMNAFEEAETYLGKALFNGGENSAEVLEHFGDALFQLDRKEEAVGYWKRALELEGENAPLQRKVDTRTLNE